MGSRLAAHEALYACKVNDPFSEQLRDTYSKRKECVDSWQNIQKQCKDHGGAATEKMRASLQDSAKWCDGYKDGTCWWTRIKKQTLEGLKAAANEDDSLLGNKGEARANHRTNLEKALMLAWCHDTLSRYANRVIPTWSPSWFLFMQAWLAYEAECARWKFTPCPKLKDEKERQQRVSHARTYENHIVRACSKENKAKQSEALGRYCPRFTEVVPELIHPVLKKVIDKYLTATPPAA